MPSPLGVMPAGQQPQRGSTIYCQVEDIHAVYTTLQSRGVRFLAPPHAVHRNGPMELWLAEFSEPDGNALALMCEMAASVPAAG